MDITTLTGRNLRRAMEAAQDGPVFIAEDGRFTHVLLTIEAYRQLAEPRRNIADALAMPQAQDGDFEPPHLTIAVKPADFA
ncbi:prevent-host-death protein [Methylobacterium sp. Leaf456]|uniref:type II toxin-antitoxin system Phd/YefM family antitoxin n=1 Tax=Methylobacterium sp. Leaf456 TaxID=1736382 RepID=UPI0007016C97|nr:type II toxin-antitoxin system Phd/YefM family antitoxin [Methylobacterium sp. Leaf456]KQT49201.1 prevent-host-death protein [Methylobacterium sp. Leaf456]